MKDCQYLKTCQKDELAGSSFSHVEDTRFDHTLKIAFYGQTKTPCNIGGLTFELTDTCLKEIKLTHIIKGFNATLNVSLLQGVKPGAVVESASGLQHFNESCLMGLTKRSSMI